MTQAAESGGNHLGELADELSRRELLELLQAVKNTSEQLRPLLATMSELQATGSLDTLVELAGVVKSLKDSASAGLVAGMLAQLVAVVGIMDRLLTLDGGRLALSVVEAFREAVVANNDQEPQTLLGLVRRWQKNPEARKSLSIITSLLEKLPAHLSD